MKSIGTIKVTTRGPVHTLTGNGLNSQGQPKAPAGTKVAPVPPNRKVVPSGQK